MSPNAKGRHCQSCAKTVVDFSIMTDVEIVSFFKNKPQNVCGRFANKQLEKQYSIVTPSQSMSYARAAALAAGLFVAGTGCQELPPQYAKENMEQVDNSAILHTDKFIIVKGWVNDIDSNSLAGVEIAVENNTNKFYSNIIGYFEIILEKDNLNKKIYFKNGDYDVKTIILDKNLFLNQELTVTMGSNSPIVRQKHCNIDTTQQFLILGDVNASYNPTLDKTDEEKIRDYINMQKNKKG
jgi:hypothetical protein